MDGESSILNDLVIEFWFNGDDVVVHNPLTSGVRPDRAVGSYRFLEQVRIRASIRSLYSGLSSSHLQAFSSRPDPNR